MKYDKEAAFERLGIPGELRQRVVVYNIPKSICRVYRMAYGTAPRGGVHFSDSNTTYIFASDSVAATDYTLAHEILGHRTQPKGLDKTASETRAVEIGLLAIKDIHQEYFNQFVARINKAQKGRWSGLLRRIMDVDKIYYAGVNLNKLLN